MDPYIYRIKNIRVKDGDTIDCTVELGFNILLNATIRLADLDTPETWRPSNEKERAAGINCKNFLLNLVVDDKYREFYIRSYGLEVYGRYTCELYYKDKDKSEYIHVNELIRNYMNESNQTKESVKN
jgi:endonuclease YncB( thermonuclease family)